MITTSGNVNRQWAVDDLISHRGDISLLDRILDYGDLWLEARSVITCHNLFLKDDGVPAWVGIEYMAQSVAAWAGTQARRQGRTVKVGFLLGSRRYETDVPSFPEGSTLRIRVEQVMMGENGLGVFDCEIKGRDPRGAPFSATANLSVYQPEEFNDLLKVKK